MKIMEINMEISTKTEKLKKNKLMVDYFAK